MMVLVLLVLPPLIMYAMVLEHRKKSLIHDRLNELSSLEENKRIWIVFDYASGHLKELDEFISHNENPNLAVVLFANDMFYALKSRKWKTATLLRAAESDRYLLDGDREKAYIRTKGGIKAVDDVLAFLKTKEAGGIMR